MYIYIYIYIYIHIHIHNYTYIKPIIMCLQAKKARLAHMTTNVNIH